MQGLQDRLLASLDEWIDQSFKRASCNRDQEVFRSCCICRDERKVDIRLRQGAEFFLGFFASFLKTLQGHWVFAEIDAVVFLELIGNVIDEGLVEIVTTEVGVAVGADDFKNLARVRVTVSAECYFENRDVERTTTKVEHDDLLILRFVQSVGEGSGGRFVDDPSDFKTGDLACVFGGLALSIVKIGRNGDNRFGNAMSQVRFGSFFEFAKNLCRDFLWGELLITDLDFYVFASPTNELVRNYLLFRLDFGVSASHKSFHRVNRAPRIGDRLATRWFADDGFAFIGKCNHAWCESIAFGIRNHFDFGAFHHGYHRVGSTQIESDDFFASRHSWVSP